MAEDPANALVGTLEAVQNRLKVRTSNIFLSTDTDEVSCLRSALFCLIKQGTCPAPYNPSTIISKYVTLKDFSDSLREYFFIGGEGASGYRRQFNNQAAAVAERLETLGLMQILYNTDMTITYVKLLIDSLVSSGGFTVAIPSDQGGGAGAAEEIIDLTEEDQPQDYYPLVEEEDGGDFDAEAGDYENEEGGELNGFDDHEGNDPLTLQQTVYFSASGLKRRQIEAEMKKAVAIRLKGASHKCIALEAIDTIIKLGLAECPTGGWVQRPVSVLSVFHQMPDCRTKKGAARAAREDITKVRQILHVARARQLIDIFTVNGHEKAVANVRMLLNRRFVELPPPPNAPGRGAGQLSSRKRTASGSFAPGGSYAAPNSRAPLAVPTTRRGITINSPQQRATDSSPRPISAFSVQSHAVALEAMQEFRRYNEVGIVFVPSENDEIGLLAAAAPSARVWVFDLSKSYPQRNSILQQLTTLLCSPGITKICYNSQWLAAAAMHQLGVQLSSVWDVEVGDALAKTIRNSAPDPQQSIEFVTNGLDGLFQDYGIQKNPRAHKINPIDLVHRTHSALSDDNAVAYLAHDAYHIISLSRTLHATLGSAGCDTVARLSAVYAKSNSMSERLCGNLRGLPRGVPLELTFEKNANYKAAYTLKTQVSAEDDDVGGTSAALGEAEGGLTVGAPWEDEDPRTSADVASILKLFPQAVADKVLELCEPPEAAHDAMEQGSEDGEVEGANSDASAASSAKWPVEIIVDVGQPLKVRFSDRTEADLPSPVLTVKRAVKLLKESHALLRGTGDDDSDDSSESEREEDDEEMEEGHVKKKARRAVDIKDIFTSDNRAGIPGTLHRISIMKGTRPDEITGLTYRIGRHIQGIGDLISDLLASLNNFHPSALAAAAAIAGSSLNSAPQATSPSLLLLGPPGVGKTTLLRDVSRILADVFHKSVMVVDTSNEIAGEGAVPHPCIGHSRRMMVANREHQHLIMKEAVQNHNPDVIVIDEISDRNEVAAAKTIAQRGVVLVGTAHGTSLENLLQNPELSTLVGGTQPVTLGDKAAAATNFGVKTRLERKGAPCFATLVEVLGPSKWRIHFNVAKSVDDLLAQRVPETQLRWLGPDGKFMAQIEGGRGAGVNSGRDEATQMALRALGKLDDGDKNVRAAKLIADLAAMARMNVERS